MRLDLIHIFLTVKTSERVGAFICPLKLSVEVGISLYAVACSCM